MIYATNNVYFYKLSLLPFLEKLIKVKYLPYVFRGIYNILGKSLHLPFIIIYIHLYYVYYILEYLN